MTDINTTGAVAPEPTEIRGVYIRNVSMEKFEVLGEAFEALDEGDSSAADLAHVVFLMFEDVICDENGERFSNYRTEDEARAVGMLEAKRYVKAIAGFTADLGKQPFDQGQGT